MTDQPDENAASGQEPKKSLRLLIKKEPMELSSLGNVLVDRLTLGVMRKLAKLLDREKNASDIDIARTLFGAVIYLPATDESEGERLLNSAELAHVTDADILTFAQAFNDRQGWSTDTGDVPPIKLLAEKLREELKKVTESINKSLNLGNSLFSESTRRLMAESALIAEQLKAYSGASEIAKQYEMAASPVDKLLKSINGSALEMAIKKQMAVVDLSAISNFSLTPPKNNISESLHRSVENSPMVRSARTLSSLDSKVDEVLEIARDIAELHGTANEVMLSGLRELSDKHEETNNHIVKGLDDFTKKWKQDEASAATSLRQAVCAIVASVVLSLVAIGQDYFTNQSNDREQLETKVLLVEQVRLATEAATNQNKITQTLEGRVKDLEGKLAAQALHQARPTKKLPSGQK